MAKDYICRIPTLAEMNRKWDYEINNANDDEKYNWIEWKKRAIERREKKQTITYYGFLGDEIICETTAAIDAQIVENSEELIDKDTAYLFAFRTIDKYQNQGYFSRLFKYMIEDLKSRGYSRVTLGVEPTETKNKAIYTKYGFTNHIKKCVEVYPDGTKVSVDYYSKNI